MSDPTPDAAAWLPAARAGSQDALGSLLEAYRGYLQIVAERELGVDLRAKGGASDIVQDTLLDAVRAFEQFQGDSESDLKKWLRRLLLNNLISFARRYRGAGKRAVNREIALQTGDSSTSSPDPAADTPTPSRQAMAHEQAERIEQAMERLPDDYRLVILLRYQEERSFEDIGRLLDLTPNAARKLWLRAVKRLRKDVEETL